MEMKIVPVGVFAANCFLVNVPETGELFIIDPGAEPEKIIAAAEKFTYSKARILLTHAHIDHISACGSVARALSIPQVEIAPEDMEMYNSPANALEPYYPAASDLPEAVPFREISCCRIVKLPGHTRGGSGFLFDDGNSRFLIAGDTIFCGSIGRTDLPGGNYAVLMNSIAENILTLPGDLTIYPGHGGETTVAFEKQHNPYLN